MEGISINLIGNNLEGKPSSVALTPEVAPELKNTEFYELGTGKTSCLVLAKSRGDTYHEKKEDVEYEKYSEKYLMFVRDENNNLLPRVLVFNLKMLTKDVYLTKPEPLNDFKSLIEEKNQKEMQSCRYQIHDNYEIFGFGPWSASTKIKRNLSDGELKVEVEEEKDYFLKEPDRTEYEQLMKINQTVAA